MALPLAPENPAEPEPLIIACLCAQWCGVCRDWRATFDTLAARLPQARCVWVDVEDQAALLGDLDIDSFPTLAVQRGARLLHCAPALPLADVWLRLVGNLATLDATQCQALAGRLADAAAPATWPDLRQFTH